MLNPKLKLTNSMLNEIILRNELAMNNEITMKNEQYSHFENFCEDLERSNCTLGADLLPTLVVPYILPQEFRESIEKHSENLVSALEKITSMRVYENKFAELLPMSEDLLNFSRIPTGFSGTQLVVRIDAFLNLKTGTFKVMEFNCGDPSGIGWNDGLITAQRKFLSAIGIGGTENLHFDCLGNHLADLLNKKYSEYLNTHKQIRPNRKLFVALVCKKGSMITSDFEGISCSLKAAGFDAQVVDPGDLKFDDQLKFNNQIVDIVYRDIIDDFYGNNASTGSEALLQALEQNKICFLNPIAAAAGDFKNIHTVMQQNEFQVHLTEDENKSIQMCLPNTDPINSENLQKARDNQAQFVIKPNLGFGGNGVVIGKEVSKKTWNDLLINSLDGNYTLQEYIDIPKETFPIFSKSKKVELADKYVNINFWVIQGKFCSAFVRVSDHSVINVCQGGGLIPVAWQK